MPKRKRDAVDEESATPEQSKPVKKQKTDTTRPIQARVPSNVTTKHTETKGSTRVPPDRRNRKLARKRVKREKEALKNPPRDESGRKDGIKMGEDDDDTGLVEIREKKSLEKGQPAASRNQPESRKGKKEGGQKLTRKHKSKKEKRRDRNVGPNGQENREKAVETATWKVSDPSGGQMLDVDPAFSPDEK